MSSASVRLRSGNVPKLHECGAYISSSNPSQTIAALNLITSTLNTSGFLPFHRIDEQIAIAADEAPPPLTCFLPTTSSRARSRANSRFRPVALLSSSSNGETARLPRCLCQWLLQLVPVLTPSPSTPSLFLAILPCLRAFCSVSSSSSPHRSHLFLLSSPLLPPLLTLLPLASPSSQSSLLSLLTSLPISHVHARLLSRPLLSFLDVLAASPAPAPALKPLLSLLLLLAPSPFLAPCLPVLLMLLRRSCSPHSPVFALLLSLLSAQLAKQHSRKPIASLALSSTLAPIAAMPLSPTPTTTLATLLSRATASAALRAELARPCALPAPQTLAASRAGMHTAIQQPHQQHDDGSTTSTTHTTHTTHVRGATAAHTGISLGTGIRTDIDVSGMGALAAADHLSLRRTWWPLATTSTTASTSPALLVGESSLETMLQHMHARRTLLVALQSKREALQTAVWRVAMHIRNQETRNWENVFSEWLSGRLAVLSRRTAGVTAEARGQGQRSVGELSGVSSKGPGAGTGGGGGASRPQTSACGVDAGALVGGVRGGRGSSNNGSSSSGGLPLLPPLPAWAFQPQQPTMHMLIVAAPAPAADTASTGNTSSESGRGGGYTAGSVGDTGAAPANADMVATAVSRPHCLLWPLCTALTPAPLFPASLPPPPPLPSLTGVNAAAMATASLNATGAVPNVAASGAAEVYTAAPAAAAWNVDGGESRDLHAFPSAGWTLPPMLLMRLGSLPHTCTHAHPHSFGHLQEHAHVAIPLHTRARMALHAYITMFAKLSRTTFDNLSREGRPTPSADTVVAFLAVRAREWRRVCDWLQYLESQTHPAPHSIHTHPSLARHAHPTAAAIDACACVRVSAVPAWLLRVMCWHAAWVDSPFAEVLSKHTLRANWYGYAYEYGASIGGRADRAGGGDGGSGVADRQVNSGAVPNDISARFDTHAAVSTSTGTATHTTADAAARAVAGVGASPDASVGMRARQTARAWEAWARARGVFALEEEEHTRAVGSSSSGSSSIGWSTSAGGGCGAGVDSVDIVDGAVPPSRALQLLYRTITAPPLLQHSTAHAVGSGTHGNGGVCVDNDRGGGSSGAAGFWLGDVSLSAVFSPELHRTANRTNTAASERNARSASASTLPPSARLTTANGCIGADPSVHTGAVEAHAAAPAVTVDTSTPTSALDSSETLPLSLRACLSVATVLDIAMGKEGETDAAAETAADSAGMQAKPEGGVNDADIAPAGRVRAEDAYSGHRSDCHQDQTCKCVCARAVDTLAALPLLPLCALPMLAAAVCEGTAAALCYAEGRVHHRGASGGDGHGGDGAAHGGVGCADAADDAASVLLRVASAPPLTITHRNTYTASVVLRAALRIARAWRCGEHDGIGGDGGDDAAECDTDVDMGARADTGATASATTAALTVAGTAVRRVCSALVGASGERLSNAKGLGTAHADADGRATRRCVCGREESAAGGLGCEFLDGEVNGVFAVVEEEECLCGGVALDALSTGTTDTSALSPSSCECLPSALAICLCPACLPCCCEAHRHMLARAHALLLATAPTFAPPCTPPPVPTHATHTHTHASTHHQRTYSGGMRALLPRSRWLSLASWLFVWLSAAHHLCVLLPLRTHLTGSLAPRPAPTLTVALPLLLPSSAFPSGCSGACRYGLDCGRCCVNNPHCPFAHVPCPLATPWHAHRHALRMRMLRERVGRAPAHHSGLQRAGPSAYAFDSNTKTDAAQRTRTAAPCTSLHLLLPLPPSRPNTHTPPWLPARSPATPLIIDQHMLPHVDLLLLWSMPGIVQTSHKIPDLRVIFPNGRVAVYRAPLHHLLGDVEVCDGAIDFSAAHTNGDADVDEAMSADRTSSGGSRSAPPSTCHTVHCTCGVWSEGECVQPLTACAIARSPSLSSGSAAAPSQSLSSCGAPLIPPLAVHADFCAVMLACLPVPLHVPIDSCMPRAQNTQRATHMPYSASSSSSRAIASLPALFSLAHTRGLLLYTRYHTEIPLLTATSSKLSSSWSTLSSQLSTVSASPAQDTVASSGAVSLPAPHHSSSDASAPSSAANSADAVTASVPGTASATVSPATGPAGSQTASRVSLRQHMRPVLRGTGSTNGSNNGHSTGSNNRGGSSGVFGSRRSSTSATTATATHAHSHSWAQTPSPLPSSPPACPPPPSRHAALLSLTSLPALAVPAPQTPPLLLAAPQHAHTLLVAPHAHARMHAALVLLAGTTATTLTAPPSLLCPPNVPAVVHRPPRVQPQYWTVHAVTVAMAMHGAIGGQYMGRGVDKRVITSGAAGANTSLSTSMSIAVARAERSDRERGSRAPRERERAVHIGDQSNNQTTASTPSRPRTSAHGHPPISATSSPAPQAPSPHTPLLHSPLLAAPLIFLPSFAGGALASVAWMGPRAYHITVTCDVNAPQTQWWAVGVANMDACPYHFTVGGLVKAQSAFGSTGRPVICSLREAAQLRATVHPSGGGHSGGDSADDSTGDGIYVGHAHAVSEDAGVVAGACVWRGADVWDVCYVKGGERKRRRKRGRVYGAMGEATPHVGARAGAELEARERLGASEPIWGDGEDMGVEEEVEEDAEEEGSGSEAEVAAEGLEESEGEEEEDAEDGEPEGAAETEGSGGDADPLVGSDSDEEEVEEVEEVEEEEDTAETEEDDEDADGSEDEDGAAGEEEEVVDADDVSDATDAENASECAEVVDHAPSQVDAVRMRGARSEDGNGIKQRKRKGAKKVKNKVKGPGKTEKRKRKKKGVAADSASAAVDTISSRTGTRASATASTRAGNSRAGKGTKNSGKGGRSGVSRGSASVVKGSTKARGDADSDGVGAKGRYDNMASFTICFPHAADVCILAHSTPLTYDATVRACIAATTHTHGNDAHASGLATHSPAAAHSLAAAADGAGAGGAGASARAVSVLQWVSRGAAGLPIPLITVTAPHADAPSSAHAHTYAHAHAHAHVRTHASLPVPPSPPLAHARAASAARPYTGVDVDADCSALPVEMRPVCFIAARVHPSETSAGWATLGLLRALCGDDAVMTGFRARHVFKVLPLLNTCVDAGVSRTGLAGIDANRHWQGLTLSTRPNTHATTNTYTSTETSADRDRAKTPFTSTSLTVPSRRVRDTAALATGMYSVRQLLAALARQRGVGVCVDLHGHSVLQGVTVYANRRFEHMYRARGQPAAPMMGEQGKRGVAPRDGEEEQGGWPSLGNAGACACGHAGSSSQQACGGVCALPCAPTDAAWFGSTTATHHAHDARPATHTAALAPHASPTCAQMPGAARPRTRCAGTDGDTSASNASREGSAACACGCVPLLPSLLSLALPGQYCDERAVKAAVVVPIRAGEVLHAHRTDVAAVAASPNAGAGTSAGVGAGASIGAGGSAGADVVATTSADVRVNTNTGSGTGAGACDAVDNGRVELARGRHVSCLRGAAAVMLGCADTYTVEVGMAWKEERAGERGDRVCDLSEEDESTGKVKADAYAGVDGLDMAGQDVVVDTAAHAVKRRDSDADVVENELGAGQVCACARAADGWRAAAASATLPLHTRRDVGSARCVLCHLLGHGAPRTPPHATHSLTDTADAVHSVGTPAGGAASPHVASRRTASAAANSRLHASVSSGPLPWMHVGRSLAVCLTAAAEAKRRRTHSAPWVGAPLPPRDEHGHHAAMSAFASAPLATEASVPLSSSASMRAVCAVVRGLVRGGGAHHWLLRECAWQRWTRTASTRLLGDAGEGTVIGAGTGRDNIHGGRKPCVKHVRQGKVKEATAAMKCRTPARYDESSRVDRPGDVCVDAEACVRTMVMEESTLPGIFASTPPPHSTSSTPSPSRVPGDEWLLHMLAAAVTQLCMGVTVTTGTRRHKHASVGTGAAGAAGDGNTTTIATVATANAPRVSRRVDSDGDVVAPPMSPATHTSPSTFALGSRSAFGCAAPHHWLRATVLQRAMLHALRLKHGPPYNLVQQRDTHLSPAKDAADGDEVSGDDLREGLTTYPPYATTHTCAAAASVHAGVGVQSKADPPSLTPLSALASLRIRAPSLMEHAPSAHSAPYSRAPCTPNAQTPTPVVRTDLKLSLAAHADTTAPTPTPASIASTILSSPSHAPHAHPSRPLSGPQQRRGPTTHPPAASVLFPATSLPAVAPLPGVGAPASKSHHHLPVLPRVSTSTSLSLLHTATTHTRLLANEIPAPQPQLLSTPPPSRAFPRPQLPPSAPRDTHPFSHTPAASLRSLRAPVYVPPRPQSQGRLPGSTGPLQPRPSREAPRPLSPLPPPQYTSRPYALPPQPSPLSNPPPSLPRLPVLQQHEHQASRDHAHAQLWSPAWGRAVSPQPQERLSPPPLQSLPQPASRLPRAGQQRSLGQPGYGHASSAAKGNGTSGSNGGCRQ